MNGDAKFMRTLAKVLVVAAVCLFVAALAVRDATTTAVSGEATLAPGAARQLDRLAGERTARVCVHHPQGVEAIPGVGPAITARQCHPSA